MVVDADGGFRTQRRDPRLALVDAHVEGGRLVLARDGVDPVEVDLATAGDGAERAVTVWRHTGPAADQGDVAAAWFSDLLDAPARLVHMADGHHRPVAPDRAVHPGDEVSFADAFPFLLTSTASLAALQAEMREPVPMERFRPNLVVAGSEPWAEDQWREVRIGDVRFAVAGACTRCAITTTDQRTGERHAEPLRALGRLRRTEAGVTFGVHLVPLDASGTVRAGDPVVVTSTDRSRIE